MVLFIEIRIHGLLQMLLQSFNIDLLSNRELVEMDLLIEAPCSIKALQ